MSQDLLLEIGCEELPAGFVDPAADFLAKELPSLLRELRIDAGAVTAEGTPRRLVVIANDVAARQRDSEEEVQGPAVSVAFNAEGKPNPALEGFLRKNAATLEQVIRIETKKGTIVALRRQHAGLASSAVLPAALEQLIARIPFKKTMRWGDRHVTRNAVFGRPVQWLLALLHNQPLQLSFADVTSSNTTCGHRYHAPEPVVVESIAHYLEVLEQGHVVLSRSQRKQMILSEAERLASAAGGRLRDDPELLEIVKNLVEKPFPLLGRFDDKFLEVPKELLISEAREHQKYFMVGDAKGEQLLACFVVVAGARAADPAALAAGNARVLRARFEDGAFYYRRDAEVRLEARTVELERLVYQRELGTMAQKQVRIADTAVWLAKQVAPTQVADAQRCANLCKNDLVSGVVNEFPELQGTMGRYYALRDGESAVVAVGIEEHYAPRTASSSLPGGVVGAVVGTADRIDSIVGLIGIGKIPTGSADPFALRRAAAAIAQVVIEHQWSLSLSSLIAASIDAHRQQGMLMTIEPIALTAAVVDFMRLRIRSVLAERAGRKGVAVSEAVVDAVMAARSGVDDVADACRRTLAVAAVMSASPAAFAALAATFKRVGNIVSQARDKGIVIDVHRLHHQPQTDGERALVNAVGSMPAAAAGDHGATLASVVAIKPLVDAFFVDAMVMVDDVALRDARLSLLARIEERLLAVCDFTRMPALAAEA